MTSGVEVQGNIACCLNKPSTKRVKAARLGCSSKKYFLNNSLLETLMFIDIQHKEGSTVNLYHYLSLKYLHLT